MDDPNRGLTDTQDWVDRGTISFEQAERIEGPGEPWAPPRFLEAMLYLGAAAFVIAALIWYADLRTRPFWEDPNHWAAFAIALAGAAVLTGIAVVLRHEGGPIGRAVGALLAAAVLLDALAISTAFEAWDLTGRWWQLALSLLIAGIAFGAWSLLRSVPTEVALYLGVTAAMTAVIEVIEEASISTDPLAATSLSPETITGTVAGILLWLLGGAWIAIGERGWLRSRTTAFFLGGTTATFAAVGLSGSVNRWWIVLLVATAAALIAAGITTRATVLLAIGTIGALVAVPIGMAGWLATPPVPRTWVTIFGIPGLLLLAGAVIWADRSRGPAAGPDPAEPSADGG